MSRPKMEKDGDVGRRCMRSDIGYRAALLDLILSNPKDYQIVPHQDRDKLANHMADSVSKILPEKVKKRWNGKWKASQLPYFYIFPKAGCHPEGPRECEKDHVHDRTIFATTPAP